MNRGPPKVELGRASCPACGDPMLAIATTKHGYPAAYCHHCDTQFQPRAERGSLLLIGRIHQWTNPEVARVMLTESDRAGLAANLAPQKPTLPPHLAPRSSPTPATPPAAPAAPKRRPSLLDREL